MRRSKDQGETQKVEIILVRVGLGGKRLLVGKGKGNEWKWLARDTRARLRELKIVSGKGELEVINYGHGVKRSIVCLCT